MGFKNEKEERFRNVCNHYKFIQKHNQDKLGWKEKLLADLADHKQNNCDLTVHIAHMIKFSDQIPITSNTTIYIFEFDELIKYIRNY